MLPLFCLQEGTSNYFKGLMLILCYLIVAASFFVHVDHLPGEFLMKPTVLLPKLHIAILIFMKYIKFVLAWRVTIQVFAL